MQAKPNKKSFEKGELKTAPDAHHQGFSHWGWDGETLWIKCQTTTKKWTRVKRIKATPARVKVILELTDGKGLDNIEFKSGSEF